MSIPKYVPERCFQGLHSHKTDMLIGQVYDIENAKLGGKMVYFYDLSNHALFTGPFFGGGYTCVGIDKGYR